MNSEELNFVKGCLALDPKERLTAKELLDHPYLSIQNSEILLQYQKSMQVTDTEEEEHKVMEIKSNMPEVIEESEVLSSSNSLIKGELTNQIRFETEHDEISGS